MNRADYSGLKGGRKLTFPLQVVLQLRDSSFN